MNNDGKIDKHEMLSWLAKNGVDEEHRAQIVEELFSKCDMDKNGTVEINEFTEEYIDTKHKLEEKFMSLNQEMIQIDGNLQRMKKEYESLRRKPGFNDRPPVGKL